MWFQFFQTFDLFVRKLQESFFHPIVVIVQLLDIRFLVCLYLMFSKFEFLVYIVALIEMVWGPILLLMSLRTHSSINHDFPSSFNLLTPSTKYTLVYLRVKTVNIGVTTDQIILDQRSWGIFQFRHTIFSYSNHKTTCPCSWLAIQSKHINHLTIRAGFKSCRIRFDNNRLSLRATPLGSV